MVDAAKKRQMTGADSKDPKDPDGRGPTRQLSPCDIIPPPKTKVKPQQIQKLIDEAQEEMRLDSAKGERLQAAIARWKREQKGLR